MKNVTKNVMDVTIDLITKLKSKSKSAMIWIDSLNYDGVNRVTYDLFVEDGRLIIGTADGLYTWELSAVKMLPTVRKQTPKLMFLEGDDIEDRVVLGYIKTNEKRSPDRLHKDIVYGEEEQLQHKAILKAKFNVEERHLKSIKITDYLEEFQYTNSLNGSLYNVMLFKYFEDGVTKNTIFNTCYINMQGDTSRVIFGEESDIDKERKWYTGRIVKALKSEEGEIYLYLNMDLIDYESDDVERVVYKVTPFFDKE